MGPSSATTPPEGAPTPRRHPATPPPGTHLGAHYSRCFGCGDAQPHGLHLDATVQDGVRVTAEFTVGPAHEGAPGLAHGGVLTAAFDEALGMLLWVLQTAAVTGRLETDFLRPVPVGQTLYIDAWCNGVDGRKIYTEAAGRVGAPDGPLAVRAAALFIAVGAEHFQAHGDGVPWDEMAGGFNP